MSRPRPSTSQGLRTLLGLILAIAAISFVTALIPPKPNVLGGTGVALDALNDPGSPSAGSPGANVTIVDFSDYQCTPCKQGEPDFERVVAADGHVRVIYKDWAALGVYSKTEAELALAAARQGKYLAVHRALMRSRARPTSGALQALAIEAGADWPRLQRDLAQHQDEIDSQLSRHAFEAWSLGLPGPPGYMVGPYLVRGRLSAGDLRRLIRKARS